MYQNRVLAGLLLSAIGCHQTSGTEPPPDGWANRGPTLVKQVVDRAKHQLLEVEQGPLSTWVQVPQVKAKAGDYILLGQGKARENVTIPELEIQVPQIVDITHAKVTDLETAKQVVRASAPQDAIAIGEMYAQLETRKDTEVVVYGTVVKASEAVGWTWVHLRDGTGDPVAGTHDLTVQTHAKVAEGQRIAFKGHLRKNVDLGFGYHYDALVEKAHPVK